MKHSYIWSAFSFTLLGSASVNAEAHDANEKKEAKRPNIIFILADDMGYGDLSCYGNKDIKTPHIDKLAQTGTRFTQCYAGSARNNFV